MTNNIEEFTKFAIEVAQKFIELDGIICNVNVFSSCEGRQLNADVLHENLTIYSFKQFEDGTLNVRRNPREKK